MSRYTWNDVGQEEQNIAGSRLADQIRQRVGADSYSMAAARDAAVAELLATTAELLNVKSFGAVGDGVADNTVAIQAAINAAVAVGGAVVFPPATYRVAGLITVSGACRIDLSGATLSWASDVSADRGLRITGSGAQIIGGEISGPQYAANVATQIGISAYGASAAAYLSGIKIRGCKIHGWGHAGVQALFVEDFRIEGCEVYDCYYAGIQILSGRRGWIEGNRVSDMIADGGINSNAYGIQVSKNNGTEAIYPRSEDVVVSRNIVSGMTTWEGLDTHGGKGIVFTDNLVTDCMVGIAVTRYDDGTTILPAENCIVSKNVIRRETMASTAVRNAIDCTGPVTPIASWSTGCSITDNTIRGYGKSDAVFGNAEGAALYAYAFNDLHVSGNVIVNSGVHGILLDYMGGGINVQANTIKDLAGASGSAFHFRARTGTPEGRVALNVIDVPGKTAFYFYEAMLALDLIHNDIVDATTHYDQLGGVLALQYAGNCRGVASGAASWDPASIAAGASASTVVTGVPGCSGNATVTLSVDRDLQGLNIQALTAATDINTGQFTVYLYNNTAAAINLAALSIRYEINVYR